MSKWHFSFDSYFNVKQDLHAITLYLLYDWTDGFCSHKDILGVSLVIFRAKFLCHQHLCCVAYRDCFVIQFCGVFCRHTLYSGQYLKNGLSDLIQIRQVDVTGTEGVLYSFVTLNSH